jgi:DNA-binding GntR family transcriptional regulator
MTPGLYPVAVARGESPRYRQIADDLRARIGSGEFPPDSLLPAGPKLEEYYDAAQATVRHAIDILRSEGLAEPEHGVGVWVRQPPDPGPSEYDRVMARLDQMDETVRQLEARLAAVERERR